MAKRQAVHDMTEDPRYHDTWKLLKRYRDVVWSMELSVQQLKTQFKVEYGSRLKNFLNPSIWLARISAAHKSRIMPGASSAAIKCSHL